MALNGIPDNLGAAAHNWVQEVERTILEQARVIERLNSALQNLAGGNN